MALAEHAGVTMQEIIRSVQGVSSIMSEIAAASKEQSLGITQVNDAVTQMDEVTQQNAALVEQAAAAAGTLLEQTVQVVQALTVFKLDTSKTVQTTSFARNTRNITPQPARLVKPKPSGKPAMRTLSASKIDVSGDWEQF